MRYAERLVLLFAIGVLASCTPGEATLAEDCVPTSADALGPYYVSGTPVVDDLNRFGKPGEPLQLTGRILSADDGQPVPAARIEIWQTDGEGAYHPENNGAYEDYPDASIDLRGTIVADGQGGYSLRTLVPGAYFPRPRHFHYLITAADHQTLVTQLYITGDQGAEQAGGGCRFAALETTPDGWLYQAPDIFLQAE